MPMYGELIVLNHEGTQLEGPRDVHKNKCSMVCEFDHTVYKPYDRETNTLQGVRRLTEFTVVKEIDRLTPQLYEIVCKGRNCKEVKLILYRTNEEKGDEEEYFHYILKDAKVISVNDFMPSTKSPDSENMGHLEKVQFLAKSFTWKYLEGGIEYTEEVA
jgi:type VI secretion system secreted protein Hcp